MPSSVIAKITYNEAERLLYVFYHSGSLYAYKEVPSATYQAMKKVRSKGAFLNQHIKGHFAYTRIK